MTMDPGMLELMRHMMFNQGGIGQEVMQREPLQDEYINREFIVAAHEETLSGLRMSMDQTKYPFQVLNTFTSILPSNIGGVELIPANQLSISDLAKSVDEVLTGKFFLCRTIAPPFKMTALATIVEDPDEVFAIRLSLYNYVKDSGSLPLERCAEILPVRTVLAIKNPWFKNTLDGGRTLRVDNPGHVVVLDKMQLKELNPNLEWVGDSDAQPCDDVGSSSLRRNQKYGKVTASRDDGAGRSKQDSQRIGNHHFVGKRYLEAIEAYTTGLKLQPTNVDLLANRAASYLNIGHFQLALTDTEHILDINPGHIKAIFRKTKALWGLRQFAAAKDFLKTQASLALPNNKQVRDLQTKTVMFYDQATYCKYPIVEIARNSTPGEARFGHVLDWVDFELPFTIESTYNGSGRGMFATNNIAPGQLILASKAFGFIEAKNDLTSTVSSNAETGCFKGACQTELVTLLIHMLRDNPERGKLLYKLYAGPKMNFLNPDKGDDCSQIDVKRIDSICSYNCFGNIESDGAPTKSAGLWIKPSYINHSCSECNCFWKLYGDFLFVRSFKFIRAGQEILIPYVDPDTAYGRREEIFQQFGFRCKCGQCKFERNVPCSVQIEVDELVRKIESLEFEQDQDGQHGIMKSYSTASAQLAIPSIERLLKIRPKYNLYLAKELHKLSAYYFKTGNFLKAFETLKTTHEIIKDTALCADDVLVCLNAVSALLMSNRKEEARQWVEALKISAIIAHETLQVFDLYPATIREIQMHGIQV